MVTTSQTDVLFQTTCSDANEIFLVGDFNGWSLTDTPMKKAADGTWRVRQSLGKGRYRFRYYVVGDHRQRGQVPWGGRRWLTDASAPTMTNRVGGRDSVIEIE